MRKPVDVHESLEEHLPRIWSHYLEGDPYVDGYQTYGLDEPWQLDVYYL